MAKHLDLEEQEQLDQLKHFWTTWGTLISAVLLVVAVSLAAWNGYKYWQNRQSAQAAALFEAVEAAALSGDQTRLTQALADIRGKYAGTTQAGQAGLVAAKALFESGNADGAKDALRWVSDKGADEGLQALAKLRLASVLMQQQEHDEALKLLSAKVPPEFDAVFADRKGDVLAAQGKNQDAIAEYSRAYKAFENGLDYRRLVEIKLNALGVTPDAASVVAAAPAGTAK